MRGNKTTLTAPRSSDVLVLGAGAAGLMCAAVAGRRGRRVALVAIDPGWYMGCTRAGLTWNRPWFTTFSR